MTDKQIKCSCGKLIAIERDGKLYIKCRGCKHEQEIEITHSNIVPRANEPRADII